MRKSGRKWKDAEDAERVADDDAFRHPALLRLGWRLRNGVAVGIGAHPQHAAGHPHQPQSRQRTLRWIGSRRIPQHRQHCNSSFHNHSLITASGPSLKILHHPPPSSKDAQGCSRIVQDPPGWSRMVQDGPRWSKMVQDGLGWTTIHDRRDHPGGSTMIHDPPGWSRMIQDGPGWFRIFDRRAASAFGATWMKLVIKLDGCCDWIAVLHEFGAAVSE